MNIKCDKFDYDLQLSLDKEDDEYIVAVADFNNMREFVLFRSNDQARAEKFYDDFLELI